MEEKKNDEVVEVTMDLAEIENVQNVGMEEVSSGPSKGFVALAIGGLAVIGIGGYVAFKKYRSKKQKAQKEETISDTLEEDSIDEEEVSEDEIVVEMPKNQKK